MNACTRCGGYGRVAVNHNVYSSYRTCEKCEGTGFRPETEPITAADIVYIAGPMSGLPDANRAAFHAAERLLRQQFGCAVLNPANQPDGLSYCRYMIEALTLLDRASAIVLLPDSVLSLGAEFERAVSRRDGKRVYCLAADNVIIQVHAEP